MALHFAHKKLTQFPFFNISDFHIIICIFLLVLERTVKKKETFRTVMGSGPPFRCRMRTLMYLMCLVMVVGVICFYTKLDFSFLRGFGFQIETIFVKVFNNEDYALKTYGCLITKYDPFDRRISGFFKKLSPFRCPQNAVDVLIYLEDGVLRVFPKAKSDIIQASHHLLKDKPVNFTCWKWTVFRNPIEKNDDIFRLVGGINLYGSITFSII